MRRFIGIALTLACFACAAHAEDGDVARAKAAALPAPSFAASAMASLTAHAIGAEPTRAALPSELARDERERNSSQSRCELSGSTVCYDLAGRRVVIAAARGYMPRIEGLKPESVSVRSRGIVLRYSFK